MDALFTEPAPSTVLYRPTSASKRTTLTELIDSKQTYAKQAHGLDASQLGDTEAGLGQIAEGSDEGDDSDGVTKSVAQGTATKLSWQSGVMVPCLLNIWGVIMFLRLGWVVGQAGLVQGTIIILFSNVVTTITALSLSAIATNGEVQGGGAYYLISRSLGPVFGGSIGVLFFVAQSIATSLYVVGFAESVVDLAQNVADIPKSVSVITTSIENDIRVIGIVTSVVLLMVALVGIGWYAKTQIILLVILVVAMLSVFIGTFFPEIPSVSENAAAGFVGFFNNTDIPLGPNYQVELATMTTHSFFTVFSVFFPAVTGIMAGANLSGDLEDPSVAIPKGTLIAIAVTLVSYIALLWFVGLACVPCGDVGDACPIDGTLTLEQAEYMVENEISPSGGLLYNKLIMESISVFAPLVYVGVFAATLSSALASLVGGPRILQSVASDKLFPWAWFNYFGAGRGVSNEPVRAYFVTFFLNCAFVIVAKLDLIAPLISNFFMITYALTNYACFAQSMSKAPGWRPSFKYYNKWLSLFGAVLCIVVMALMDPVTCVITILITGMLMVYLTQLDPDVNWGPAGEARKYVHAMSALEALLGIRKSHAKTFRPQYLLMAGEPGKRLWLTKFVSMLHKGKGLTIHADVVIDETDAANVKVESVAESTEEAGEGAEVNEEDKDAQDEHFHTELAMHMTEDFHTVRNRRIAGEMFLSDPKIWTKRMRSAFADAVSSPDVLQGFKHLVHTSGLGNLRPNTLVLGFKKNWVDVPKREARNYESIIRVAMACNLGVMVVRDDKEQFDLDVRRKLKHQSVLNWFKRKDADVPEKPTDEHKKPTTLPGDRIDVWWVADDGGLTMLLPYLLQQSKNFKGKKLRVLTVSDYNSQESLKLQRSEYKMVHLLQKFRIDAEVHGVDAKLDTLPSAGTLKLLETRCKVKVDEINADYKDQTMRMLRLSELFKQHSKDASVVFASLPIPESGMPVSLFMSWMEMLTCDLPPSVLMRGNNESVLTFFC